MIFKIGQHWEDKRDGEVVKVTHTYKNGDVKVLTVVSSKGENERIHLVGFHDIWSKDDIRLHWPYKLTESFNVQSIMEKYDT